MFTGKNNDDKLDYVMFNNEKDLIQYMMISQDNKELLPSIIAVNHKKLMTEKLNIPLLIIRNFGPLEFMDIIFNIYRMIEKIHSNNPSIHVTFPPLSRIHDDGRVKFLQFNNIDIKNNERLQKYTLMKSLKDKIIDKVFPNFANQINIDYFYNEPINKLKEFMGPLFSASYEERKISPYITVMDINVVKEGRFNKLSFFKCNCVSRSIKIQKTDPLYHLFGDIGEKETRCYPVFQNNMKFISGDFVKTFL